MNIAQDQGNYHNEAPHWFQRRHYPDQNWRPRNYFTWYRPYQERDWYNHEPHQERHEDQNAVQGDQNHSQGPMVEHVDRLIQQQNDRKQQFNANPPDVRDYQGPLNE